MTIASRAKTRTSVDRVKIFLSTNNHALISAVQSLLVGFATVASGTSGGPRSYPASRAAPRHP
jgi:hypothetical protein